MIGEHDTRVWRVVKYYVEDARSREDFSDVSIIGIDETSSANGHKYVTLVMDFATSKVIHVCRGKDALTLSTFKEDYLMHRGNHDKIASVCCDMSPAFIGGIGTEFPNASITVDKFHINRLNWKWRGG
jgi:transposase